LPLVRWGLIPIVGVLAALFAGCGAPDFDDRSFEELESGLARHGVEICSAETRHEPPNAVAAREYRVALDCQTAEEDTVIDAVEWEDQDARDAAASRAEGSGRNDPVPLWVFGSLTVSVPGFSDDATYDRVADALGELEDQ
jgi:hypothetical protein